MTLPGIPCLYYGTEFALLDEGGKVGEDGETGRMMFYPRTGRPDGRRCEKIPRVFRDRGTRRIAREACRCCGPAILIPLWVDSGAGGEDDGVFAFARASDDRGDLRGGGRSTRPTKRASQERETNRCNSPPPLKTAGQNPAAGSDHRHRQRAGDLRVSGGRAIAPAGSASSLVVYEPSRGGVREKSAARESAASPDKLPLLRSRPGGVRLPNLHGP